MGRGFIGFLFTLASLFLLGSCANCNVSGQTQEKADYLQAYVDQINACEEDVDNLEYDLIYLNEDDIPELVVDKTGYEVSIYTYSSGELYTIMDHWPYGAMGNAGYEYIPRKNVIRNYNADLAGAIMYISYDRVNENYEIESYYDAALSSWSFRDSNHNYFMDENEPVTAERFHYYGEKEITAEEFDTYMIRGKYAMVQGKMCASEMIATLQANQF